MILRNIAVALAFGLGTAAHADPLMIESQGSFFIGGHDVKSDALSGLSGLRCGRHGHGRPDVRPLPGAGRAPRACRSR